MYGFNKATRWVDGAYFRDVILTELCVPDIDRIYSVRPIHRRWIGPLPNTWTAAKDLETEVSFNGAYIGERNIIELMNKVGVELEEVFNELKARKIDVSEGIERSLRKYKCINLIDVDMDEQRGYFDYVFEDKKTFTSGKRIGRQKL